MRSAKLTVHYELFTMGLVLIMKLIVGRVQEQQRRGSGSSGSSAQQASVSGEVDETVL